MTLYADLLYSIKNIIISIHKETGIPIEELIQSITPKEREE